MDGTTEQLVDYSLTVRGDVVPETTVGEARRKLVDAIACALGGLNAPPTRVARRLALRAPGTAGVFGAGQKGLPELAAFANSLAIRQADYNDTYPGCHPSDLLGGVLAFADMAGADGRQVLGAMVVGYEVCGALMDAAFGKSRDWDMGLYLSIGTACALGNLLGLSREQAGHAIAIATVEGPALRETRAGELSMWKGAATPNGVRNGAFAVLLALEGMTGPGAPFEGQRGLFAQITGPFEVTLPFPDAGSPRMLATSHKYFPVDYNAQAAVWAALDLRAQVPFDEVESIRVVTYEHARNESAGTPNKWDPQTRETADHSTPFVMARTWKEGYFDMGQFEPDRLLDPGIRPFMRRITVEADPSFPNWRETITFQAEVTSKGGRRYETRVLNPKGHPANPMLEADLDAKFRRMAAGVLEPNDGDALIRYLWRFDEAPTVSDLFRLTASAGKS